MIINYCLYAKFNKDEVNIRGFISNSVFGHMTRVKTMTSYVDIWVVTILFICSEIMAIKSWDLNQEKQVICIILYKLLEPKGTGLFFDFGAGEFHGYFL